MLKDVPQSFWNHCYTFAAVAAKLPFCFRNENEDGSLETIEEARESRLWTLIKMYGIPCPCWLTNTQPVWMRDVIDEWLSQGCPADAMVKHRRRVLDALRKSRFAPDRSETVKADSALVGLTDTGQVCEIHAQHIED